MKNHYDSKDLAQKIKEINPTLSNRFYEPDFSKPISRWVVKTFRTNKGFRAFNSQPYSMTQIPGAVVYGECKPDSGEIDIDLTKEGYRETLYHEDRHVAGDDEYLARFHTANANYSLAA